MWVRATLAVVPLDAMALWRRLSLPSFVALSWLDGRIGIGPTGIVERCF
jgi:hypothetical protein